MDKVLKQDSSKCITPSSDPFRIDLERLGLKHYVSICKQINLDATEAVCAELQRTHLENILWTRTQVSTRVRFKYIYIYIY
jgi:hypothetical protein